MNLEDEDVQLVAPKIPKPREKKAKERPPLHLYMWCKKCLKVAAQGLHNCPYKEDLPN